MSSGELNDGRHAAPNKRIQWSARSEFVIVPVSALARPLMRSVRTLSTLTSPDTPKWKIVENVVTAVERAAQGNHARAQLERYSYLWRTLGVCLLNQRLVTRDPY